MDATYLGFTNKPYIWIDPRSKFILFLTANIALWGGVDLVSEVLFVSFLLMIFINGKQFNLSLKIGILYFLLVFMDIYITPMLSGIGGVLVLTITRVMRKYLPIFVTAIFLIRTTTVSEFVAAFNKIKVSEKIIIPFSVMFRFFPTLVEEWNNIQNAMKFRGIQLNFKTMIFRPIKTLEYILVPLLMSSLRIANDLSAASLSRGLGGEKERTCIKQISFGIFDYIVLLISIIFSVYTLIS